MLRRSASEGLATELLEEIRGGGRRPAGSKRRACGFTLLAMLLARDRELIGEPRSGRWFAAIGWAVTIALAVLSIALVAQLVGL